MMKFDPVNNSKLALALGMLITALFAFVARFFYTYTVNDSEVEYYEIRVQENLPYYLGYIGSVTSVYKTKEEMVYVCEVNEQNVSIENLKSNERGTRQNCKLSLLCNQGKSNQLFNILEKYDMGIKVVYKGAKDSVEVKFSSDDIKKIAADKVEPKKLAFQYMEKYVSEKNAACPIMISDDMSLVGFKLDKSTLYYYHTVEESDRFSLDSLQDNKTLGEFIKNSSDPNVKSVARKVVTAGLGIELVYTSKQTGFQKSFVFSNKELFDVLMEKEDVLEGFNRNR